MRTTLTLDADVERRLRERVRESDGSFKQIVNETLRRGLDVDRDTPPLEPYRVEARDLGLRPGISLDSVAGVLEQLEGPHAP